MTHDRGRRFRQAVSWLLPVGVVVVALAAVAVLGLTWPLATLSLVGAAAAVAARAVVRLRAERAEHEATQARWNAAEAVLAERLRIARDLHDIVSHGLGMITVRAAAAAHLHARKPDEKELMAAIADVEALSRQATVELRRMLQALREVDNPASRHPTDDLASLPKIIADARRAGLRVDLHQDELGPVSSGAQTGICAVVREGLANSTRHAGLTRVEVNLARAPDAVVVTITDDGPSPGWAANPGPRHGLIGLRERTISLGGTITAAPHPPGFRLEATIPDGTT